MGVNRRQFLLGGLGLAAAATTIGLTGCAPGSSDSGGGGGDAGTAELAFAWWGNDVRNKNTTNAIDAYTKANPGVKISPQPGEWASYWDKLATQVAGNTAPDIIQMDMAYISEYGNRGALLDLSDVDTSKFIEGTVDSGKINDTLYGVNAGINCLVILANPKIFEKAGVDIPDDKTWTWDSLVETAAEVASKTKLTFGMQSLNSDNLFQAWIRQQGKELFTTDGKLGFETADVQGWFDYLVKAEKAGAIGTPSAMNEEATKSLTRARSCSARRRWRCPTPTSWRPSRRPPAPTSRSCATRPSPPTPLSARRGTRPRCCGRPRPRRRTPTRSSPSSTGW